MHLQCVQWVSLLADFLSFTLCGRQLTDTSTTARSNQGLALTGKQCSCLREIQCLAGMPAHRHIVGHYRAWQEAAHFYIQMDLCENGTLTHCIQQQVGPLRKGGTH